VGNNLCAGAVETEGLAEGNVKIERQGRLRLVALLKLTPVFRFAKTARKLHGSWVRGITWAVGVIFHQKIRIEIDGHGLLLIVPGVWTAAFLTVAIPKQFRGQILNHLFFSEKGFIRGHCRNTRCHSDTRYQLNLSPALSFLPQISIIHKKDLLNQWFVSLARQLLMWVAV
jgi:hypothetical protein